jgi:thiamine biosynthesis protein ThiS
MIQVNGDPLDWHEGMTVLDVLKARNFKFPLLIISIDGTFVAKGDYATTPVPDGADVKVVHLLSGG